MSNEAQQLLSAEQVIQELLLELGSLKAQIGGYDTARQSLQQTQGVLSDLVVKTSTLAEQTHEATLMLGKVGTPEIILRIDGGQASIKEFADLGFNNVNGNLKKAAEFQVNKIHAIIKEATELVQGSLRDSALVADRHAEEIIKMQKKCSLLMRATLLISLLALGLLVMNKVL